MAIGCGIFQRRQAFRPSRVCLKTRISEEKFYSLGIVVARKSHYVNKSISRYRIKEAGASASKEKANGIIVANRARQLKERASRKVLGKWIRPSRAQQRGHLKIPVLKSPREARVFSIRDSAVNIRLLCTVCALIVRLSEVGLYLLNDVEAACVVQVARRAHTPGVRVVNHCIARARVLASHDGEGSEQEFGKPKPPGASIRRRW